MKLGAAERGNVGLKVSLATASSERRGGGKSREPLKEKRKKSV